MQLVTRAIPDWRSRRWISFSLSLQDLLIKFTLEPGLLYFELFLQCGTLTLWQIGILFQLLLLLLLNLGQAEFFLLLDVVLDLTLMLLSLSTRLLDIFKNLLSSTLLFHDPCLEVHLVLSVDLTLLIQHLLQLHILLGQLHGLLKSLLLL